MNTVNESIKVEDVLLLMDIRIEAYDLLRKLFLAEPTKEMMEELATRKVFDAFPFKDVSSTIHNGVNTISSFFQDHSPTDLNVFESLHWDYTRMFIGPFQLPAPPWGSVYLGEEKTLFQEETLQVRRAYLKYGFQSKQHGIEADDHIGLELDMMYQLVKLAKQDVLSDNPQSFLEITRDQLLFLENHLLSWVPAFSRDMKKTANTDFYKGVAELLYGYLELDRKMIDEITDYYALNRN
ncbi:TorD/DmsD family molecular chaperone [Salipaludibacillus daqingensis]|uniref:TorD/DmsD family molecular chaperone n=1 Tax=Salipaludibacillus daqingensis TaxID=3041001 RepID=UPI0024743E61|nr:molecular chaperone TorD family protein [Salipaludibacillus daqingensis]